MATFELTTPTGEVFEVEAATVDAAIAALPPGDQAGIPVDGPDAQDRDPIPETDVVEQGLSGVNEGIAQMLGAPVDFANWSFDLVVQGVNKLGAEFETSEDRAARGVFPFAGSEQITGAMESAGMIAGADPRTVTQRFARRVGQEVGAGIVAAPAGLALGTARTGAALAVDMASDASAGFAAQAAQEYLPGSVTAELVSSLAGSVAGATAASRAVNKRRYKNEVNKSLASTPTKDSLRSSASNLYEEANRNGITATADQVKGMNDDMISIMINEGLLSPKGRITEGYPKVNGAQRLLGDFSGSAMNPLQMRQARRAISKAAGSTDPQEARVGVQMLKSFDAFTSPLTPGIARANKLYTAAMRGNTVEEAVEIAAINAGGESGPKFEKALRSQFKGLSRQIAKGKGKLRGLSDEQKSAINRVGEGGDISPLLEAAGRLSPTSPLSGAVTTGVPFAIGTAIAGPQAGLALSTGVLAVGKSAEQAVGRGTQRNVEVASAVMRGMALPFKKQNTAELSQALATWLAQNAELAAFAGGS